MNQRRVSFSLNEYYNRSPAAVILDRMVLAVLIFLILAAPLPFGSVEYSYVTAIEIIAVICCTLWIIKLIFCGNRMRWLEFRKLTFHEPASCYSVFGYPVENTGLERIAVLFFILLGCQLTPIPSTWAAYLSPSAHQLYETAATAAGRSLYFHPLSLDPFTTFSKILEYLAYFMFYLVVVNNIHKPQHVKILVYAICISALFQSLYGLYELLSGREQIFFYEKTFNRGVATGTFINRNHYATFLGMSLPFILSLLVADPAVGKMNEKSLFKRIGGRSFFLLISVAVATAIFLSFSRSGILFTILSVTVFFFLYWKMKQQLARKAFLPILATGFITISILVWFEPLANSFRKLPDEWTEEGYRRQVWMDSFRICLDFPLLGSGAGTFEKIFPIYDSAPDQTVYKQAHNDYLQLLTETGLVLFFLYVALFVRLANRLKVVLSSSLRHRQWFQLGAFCSLFALALQSLSDFSLQIPAVAFLGAIAAGLYFTRSHATETRNHS